MPSSSRVLLLVALATACSLPGFQKPGHFSLHFEWDGGPPQFETTPFVLGRVEERSDVTQAGTVLQVVGPIEYRPGAKLSFDQVKNGDNRVVIIEFLKTDRADSQVLYYGLSEPFSLHPGDNKVITVRLKLRAGPAPVNGGIEIVTPRVPGITGTALVDLRLRAEGASAVQLSNDLTLLEAAPRHTLADLRSDGAGGTVFEGWNLEEAVPAIIRSTCDVAMESAGCPRRVYARFIDSYGYASPAVSSDVVLDQVAPKLLADPTLFYQPNASNPLSTVDSAALGTLIQLSFAFTERTASDPVVVSVPAGLTFSRTSAVDTTFQYAARVQDASLPSSFTLALTVEDRVGNTATLTPVSPVGAIDFQPPPPPDTTYGKDITYVRVPWGSDATGGTPSYFVEGGPGSLPAGTAYVVAYDGWKAQLANQIGFASVQADGSFRMELNRQDRPLVLIAALDAAGNASRVVPVEKGRWIATLRSKRQGDLASNPNVVREVEAARLSPSPQDPSLLVGEPLTMVGMGDELSTSIPRFGYEALQASSDGPLYLFNGSVDGRWDAVRSEAVEPPPRFLPAMSYDANRGRTTLFGGRQTVNGNSFSLSDLWEYDGAGWHEIQGATGPSARDGAALAPDGRGNLLLFGGYDAASGTFLSDTWLWNGRTWESNDTSAPTARSRYALSYDSLRRVTVLTGGGDAGTLSAGTWEYVGGIWQNRTTATSFSHRVAHATAFDEARGRTVLFGGQSATGTLLADTWTWDGTTWTLMTPTVAPSPRRGHVMTYDTVRQRVVLFGGCGAIPNPLCGDELGDTWEWDGATWSQVSAGSPTVGRRASPSLAYDVSARRSILFGGQSASTALTAGWDGAQWQDRSAASGPHTRNPAVAFNGAVLVFGGSQPDGTWRWDGARWEHLTGGLQPPSGTSGLMAWDSARDRVVLVTASDGSQTVETWEWDDTSWTRRYPSTTPTAAQALTYDAARHQVVLIGLSAAATSGEMETWLWNGTDWTLADSGGVSPRRQTSIAFDEVRSRVVLFGGNNGGTALGDTWEWDGQHWAIAGTDETFPPDPRFGHTLAWDPGRRRVVMVGGHFSLTKGVPADDVEEWDGSQWFNDNLQPPIPGRLQWQSVVGTGARGRLWLAGEVESAAPFVFESARDATVRTGILASFPYAPMLQIGTVDKVTVHALVGGRSYPTELNGLSYVNGAQLARWDRASLGWRVLGETEGYTPSALTGRFDEAWDAPPESLELLLTNKTGSVHRAPTFTADYLEIDANYTADSCNFDWGGCDGPLVCALRQCFYGTTCDAERPHLASDGATCVACTSDAHCPVGQLCAAGSCVGVSCLSDADCGGDACALRPSATGTSWQHRCVTSSGTTRSGGACSQDSDCATGNCFHPVNGAADGFCLGACRVNADCDGAATCPVEGLPVALPGPDGRLGTTDDGSATTRVCWPPACTSNHDCEGLSATGVERVCRHVPRTGGSGFSLACLPPVGPERLPQTCVNDSECASGVCGDWGTGDFGGTEHVRRCFVACSATADCAGIPRATCAPGLILPGQPLESWSACLAPPCAGEVCDACLVSSQCPEGGGCYHGTCIGNACASSDDCPGGQCQLLTARDQSSLSPLCQPVWGPVGGGGACHRNEDCASGSCVLFEANGSDGFCHGSVCRDEDDCAPGASCPEHGSRYRLTGPDMNYGTPDDVETSGPSCRPPSCAANNDCLGVGWNGAPRVCVFVPEGDNDTDVYAECRAPDGPNPGGAPCSDFGACAGGYCFNWRSADGLAQRSECAAPCESNSDCTYPGARCLHDVRVFNGQQQPFNTCQVPVCSPSIDCDACRTSEDCGPGLGCQAGTCQPIACRHDADCGTGACVEYWSTDHSRWEPKCVAQRGSVAGGGACAGNADCRSGLCYFATGSDGICLDACLGPADCAADARCPADGVPTALPGSDNQWFTADDVQESIDICWSNECASDWDCLGTGFEGADRACTWMPTPLLAQTTQVTMTCMPSTGSSPGGATNLSDCHAGYNIHWRSTSGTVRDECYGACESDLDCTYPGASCVHGNAFFDGNSPLSICAVWPCGNDSDCASVSGASHCRTSIATCVACLNDSQCASGERCNSEGRCVEPALDCQALVDCAQSCADEECVRSCRPRADTPAAAPYEALIRCVYGRECPHSNGGICDPSAAGFDAAACRACVTTATSFSTATCLDPFIDCYLQENTDGGTTPDGGLDGGSHPDAGTTPDAGRPDGGSSDGGVPDAGRPDGGSSDGGPLDAGSFDGGPVDGGSSDGGSSDGGSSDGGTPRACDLRVTPAYAATPYPINFGAVTINTTAVQDIVIENVGSGTCALTAPSIEADFLAMGASAFAILQAPPTTLGAGQIATMQVGFTPTSTGSFGGGSFGYVALLLPTADTASFPGDACTVHGLLSNITGAPGCVGWTLQGTGVESAVPTTMLAAVPESLVARPARSQCNSLNTVQLYNMGNQSMTITGVEVIPSTASFAIVSPSTQVVLSAGTSTPISVRFQPGSSSISATIRITASSNGSSVTLDIPASGTVATSANQVDSFVQNASTKADLLFIVDDSGSMTEEQAQFAPGASALLQYAATLGIDYRAAVITTDMEDPTRSGRFQGTPRVITRSDADPSTEISQTILALGTSGSGTEQGLAAAKTALSSPLITDSLTNGGFLRPEAKLGIIVLSDEDDQSTGPTNYYLDFLRQLKASSGGKELSFSAIVGPASGMNSGGEPGCLSGNYEAVTGSRYIAVQEATGGVFESICTLDATRFGQALAQRIVPNRSTFALSRVPSGAISVRVNGSTQTAFSYDSALNAVVFNTAAVPSAGSSVEVSYSVACSAP